MSAGSGSGRAPFRVGLIGYGYSGRTFHAPLIAAEPGLALVAVGSSDPAKVAADLPDAAVFGDPLALAAAPGLDLVVIATPNDSHAPLARAALAAGRHVVIDKPFALSLAEAREVAACARASGRLLSVFHNRRFDSDFLTVAAAIRDGLAGEVAHLESHFDRFRPAVRDRWRERAGPGAGIWFDLGPHLADQALVLFGLPDGVSAGLARQRPGAAADDWAHVVLDWDGGRRAVLHAGMLVAGGSPRFVVHGTGGSLVKRAADRQEAQLLAGMAPGAPGWGEDADPLLAYGPDGVAGERPALAGDQRRFYAGIAAALAGEGPNPVPPAQALAVMAVVAAATGSAARGGRMPLALTDAERAAFEATSPRA